MWRDEVNAKRRMVVDHDELGAVRRPVSLLGPAARQAIAIVLVVNASTGAWCRFAGCDATCFIRMRDDMFFGTQDGYIMQADRTGYDDGQPYVATLVGGWEAFQAPAQTITWRQARASFAATAGQPFQPQLSATVDYVVILPTPPPPGPRPPVLLTFGIRDIGGRTWAAAPPCQPPQRSAYAQWDQPYTSRGLVRNTMWVSIGVTGFSHAPIVQVTVAQNAAECRFDCDFRDFERAGINV